jgi:predicted phosphodiesterase
MNENEKLHYLVSKLKDYAIELGRTPTRNEFIKLRDVPKSAVEHFGFTELVMAAGLQPNKVVLKKSANELFIKPIQEHISNHKPKTKHVPKRIPSAAIISDIHWPFHCKKTIENYLKWIKEKQPEFAVINGDAWDFYSAGKFPRSHNVFTPKEEEDLAKNLNADFWKTVKEYSPKTRCIQLLGNHDVRPVKRMAENLPTMEHWIEKYFKDLFTFEGVETIFDTRQEFFLNEETVIFHGYRSKLGDHRDFTGMNCIIGHTHKPGIVYKSMGIGHETKWEANSGLAGDPTAKGLTYTPQRITGWTNSFLWLDEHGPRVIVT